MYNKEYYMTNRQLNYEEVKIELISLCECDVIATSGAFDGEDDNIGEWS